MESDGTDISTTSVPHELVYVHVQTSFQNRPGVILWYTTFDEQKGPLTCKTQRKHRFIQFNYTNDNVYCAHVVGVLRKVTKCIRQAANNVATLFLAFTSNPQDFTRNSTMDNWPLRAAQCKAVEPSSSESNRWPSILGARYWAVARWPPAAHKRKALRPRYIEQWEEGHKDHYLCTHTCRMHKKYWIMCGFVHIAWLLWHSCNVYLGMQVLRNNVYGCLSSQT